MTESKKKLKEEVTNDQPDELDDEQIDDVSGGRATRGATDDQVRKRQSPDFIRDGKQSSG